MQLARSSVATLPVPQKRTRTDSPSSALMSAGHQGEPRSLAQHGEPAARPAEPVQPERCKRNPSACGGTSSSSAAAAASSSSSSSALGVSFQAIRPRLYLSDWCFLPFTCE